MGMLPDAGIGGILDALQERARELTCLYRVHEICKSESSALDEILRGVVDILPNGWQHPAECFARVEAEGVIYETPGYPVTPWTQASPIRVQGEIVGTAEVVYRRAMPEADEGPFLKEHPLRRVLPEDVAE